MKHLSPAEIKTIRVPEPKHDPFSLESLVAWLERQPADEVYCYTSTGHCLLAQYFSAHGFGPEIVVGVQGFHVYDGEKHTSYTYDYEFDEIAVGSWNETTKSREGQNFSAALTRARAALASQKGNANG